MESPENSSPQETETSHEETTTATTTKTRTNNHPRRFSGEQIKSLESIFKLDTKLDPTKKLQIAKDLGLHPRQVAIWFQNKRARWRSKQIEHEYKLLRSDYNTLSVRFEDLKREKLSLQMQLQELSDAVKNLDNVKIGEVKEEYPNSSSEGMDHNDEKMINSYFEKAEDQEFVSWGQEADINQTWRNLSSSSGLFDRSTGDSNWWES